MKEFLLFRHGETEWNNQGRLQGSADIPLNKTGLKQAEALREYFDTWRADGLFQVERQLISSDLDRALATARIAFRCTPEDRIQVDKRFRETHMGLAEGLTYKELMETFGEQFWLSWTSLGKASWQARFPKGESKGEVRDRALAGLLDLVAHTSANRFAIATHGGLLRRLLYHLHPEETKPIDVPNGAVFRFQFENGVLRADKKPVFEP